MELENVVLSCIYYDEKGEFTNLKLIDKSWFKNKSLFERVIKYREDKKPIEELIATEVFTKEEHFMLMTAINGIHNLHNFEHIYKKFISIRVQEKIVDEINAGNFDPGVYWKILKEISLSKDKGNVYDFSDDIQRYLKEYEIKLSGNFEKYSLELQGIDGVLGAVRPKALITVGANSGVGKSNIMLKIMSNLLQQNVRCLFLTSEMGYDEILERIAGMNADLSLYKIRNAKLNPEETQKYLEVIRTKIYEKQGHILEMAKFDIGKIRKIIDEIKPKFIFVDYIQRFNLETSKNLSRAAVLSDIVNELKVIAMECGVVVIAASQMNRTADRSNINIGALKESGAIEEASDVVILLSEIEKTDKEKAIKIEVAKNRHGITGEFMYIFDRKTCDMRYSQEFTDQIKNKRKEPEFLDKQNPAYFQS